MNGKNENRPYVTLYWGQVAILISGCIAGLVAAWLVGLLPLDFSGELIKAKQLGIVSATILAGYPKSKDIVTYLTVLGLPIIFATGLWFIWARGERRKALGSMLDAGDSAAYKATGRIWLLAMAACCLIFSFNVNYFRMPVSGWQLLGEEGENLAWVQSILSGGVYAKDFFCLYGPMLIYPLAWAMKILGATIFVERLYTYLLNLIAYGIIITFLFRTLKGNGVFVLSSALYIIAFSPFLFSSPNCSYLRVALGVLPLLLAHIHLESHNRLLLPVTGVVLGQSLLFSQEVGVCSAIALGGYFLLNALQERDFGGFLKKWVLILAGCLVSVAPMLIYFYLKGALGPFFATLYGYPRLVTLGYGALPFPDFKIFLAAPLANGALLPYWVVFVYVFAAISLLPMLLMGRLDKGNMLRASLLIFGALLFRSALGRSDEYHVYYASQPAFLLLFLFLDTAVKGISKACPGPVKIGRLCLALALLLSVCLLFMKCNTLNVAFNVARHDIFNFRQKWSSVKSGYEFNDLERGGVFFDPATTLAIMKIRQFLDTNTKPGENVYFFPNEALYYFLFNRNNPTRYAISYFAVTREQRLDLIADLEKKRPRYVIYSLNTWRVDDIMEDVQVPEVVAYLRGKYRPAQNLGDVQVLERVGA